MNDPIFELFWKAYPRKRCKEDARKAWAKLHADEELLTLMLRALQWQVREWDDMNFVPHAGTWLNGRRWEDENPNERRGGIAASISEVLAQLGRKQ